MKPPPTPEPAVLQSSKRRDLQGVRALAVLLVVFNHAHLGVLPGGYVGVDVFFVLSGFFITGLLLREGNAKLGGPDRAKISLREFYERRIRRIVPAATLTIVATSVAVYVVYDLLHHDYMNTKPTLLDGLASSLFYANFHFAANSTNYFTVSANSFPSPFQHFWSLSLEEQFYFVWPVTMLALYAFADRLGGRRVERARSYARRLIGTLLVVVLAFSLYWSWHYTKVNPAAAYFVTFTRVWELALGALLALALSSFGSLRQQPPALRLALGVVGLAAILYASLAFTSTTAFPGLAALIPTLGTAALVLAGHGVHRTIGVNRLLATTPMTFVGDRSYTYYLWHYPALIITWQMLGHYSTPLLSVLILAGAFALSCLTYAIFENPIRFSKRIRGWKTFPIGFGMLGASTATAFAGIALFTASLSTEVAQASAAQRAAESTRLTSAQSQPAPTSLWNAKPIPALAAAIRQVKANAPIPAYFPTVATLLDPNQYESDLPNGCIPAFGPGTTFKICPLGDLKSNRTIVLAGDSHAQMWDTTLVKVATELHYRVVVLAKPGCFVTRVMGQQNAPGWPCVQWYRSILAEDRSLHPVATLIDYISFYYPNGRSKVYVNDLFRIAKQSVNPVIIADTPDLQNGHGAIDTADCLTGSDPTMASCAGRLPPWFPKMLKSIQTTAQRSGIPTIATLHWVCGQNICPPIINHTVVFRDNSHLSIAYDKQLAPLFKSELQAALKRLAAR